MSPVRYPEGETGVSGARADDLRRLLRHQAAHADPLSRRLLLPDGRPLHPPAVVQRRHDRDIRPSSCRSSDLTEPSSRLALLCQAVLLRHAAGKIPPVLDVDVADAAGAVAATLETATKGIVYEHQPTSVPAHRLAAEWRAALAALAPKPSQVARLEKDAAIALRRLEQGATTPPRPFPGTSRPSSSTSRGG